MTDFDFGDLDREELRGLLSGGPTALFATVSGAHLYGFPSPDSDVDLRGAFVLPLRDVLSLAPPQETQVIERIEKGRELDWVAHDVHKFCRLMTRRNGYVLEQLYSPWVVLGGPWLDELREIGRGCVVRHLHHHYRGFTHNQRKEVGKRPTVKALLYVYRVLLTGIHVLSTGEIEASLPTLAEAWPKLAPAELDELVARKRAGKEKALLKEGELALHESRFDALEARMQAAFEASSLPDEPTTRPALSDFVVRARLELGQSA